ncbi:PmbA/TldA family metallopeptidase [Thermococcus sp. JCM 11816]|uniref:PmbA/TldA family metallopeptidase n=1 Tax=Thermococcus sp. (strain JCM 11816 / KS-1) TaxID=1295125 RepID=UPI000A73421E
MLSGKILDVLKSIRAIGKDVRIEYPGYCGKGGQSVPVDDGGPHILTKALVGGIEMIDVIESLAGILNSKDVEWEIYWESGRSGSFRIERETLDRSQRKFYSGIGLRVGLNGKLGFSYITGIHHSRSELEKFVERTIKLAKVSEVPFRGFPVPSKVPKVKNIRQKDRRNTL